MRSNRLCAGLVLACAVIACEDSASGVPIYGGPGYDEIAGSGYLDPELPLFPGASIGNSSTVGSANRINAGSNRGLRAVRWDAYGQTELGNIGTNTAGFTESMANAVNNAGITVGYANKYDGNTDRGPRAVRWDVSGVATELGVISTNISGAANSNAIAVNASGTTVGNGQVYSGNTMLGLRAVRWDAGTTTATELGNLGTKDGFTNSSAHAINAAGTTVGYATYFDSLNRNLGIRAVRWDTGSTAATELGNLGVASNDVARSNALAINSAGTIVGHSAKYVGVDSKGDRAVRWDAGSNIATELGNLGLDVNGFASSSAVAVNETGTATGWAVKYVDGLNVGERAVRWNAGTTAAIELGHLGVNSNGITRTVAYGINNGGTVVGYAREGGGTSNASNRAVAWGTDGFAVNLNTLLSPADAAQWNLTQAFGISDTNWVSGRGSFDPDGDGPLASYSRLFLLDVISVFGKKGDATRDGHVTFDDLLIVARNYGQTSGATWDDADFSGDGRVNFDDLLVLAKNYEPTLAPTVILDSDFTADWTLAQSLVPEPASVSLGLAAGMSLVRRKRT